MLQMEVDSQNFILKMAMQEISGMICLASSLAAAAEEMQQEKAVPTAADFIRNLPEEAAGTLAAGDVEAEVAVDFDEAALGCEKVIRLSGNDGKIQSFKVRIPAGMDDGEQLRLKGKGHAGTDGTTGDLFLKIKIRPKNGCERKGLDIYTTVTIPYATAALGGKARIHTLYGDVDCNIKSGTQDGSKIRLRGKGIVSRKNPSVHGDQYVKVQIQVPKYLSPEAKKKLQEYSAVC